MMAATRMLLLLALLALVSRQSLHVPRALWPRLVLAAFRNVAVWMALMGLALLYLPASGAALLAYAMPSCASMLTSQHSSARQVNGESGCATVRPS